MSLGSIITSRQCLDLHLSQCALSTTGAADHLKYLIILPYSLTLLEGFLKEMKLRRLMGNGELLSRPSALLFCFSIFPSKDDPGERQAFGVNC
jgi:hypothetical protein